MTLWLIEPRDPVIFRDGRPFNASPGARAKTLPFPLPATTAGATRSRAGQDTSGRFDRSRTDELLGKWVRGPLLVELTDGKVSDWLFPAPHDALLLKHETYDKHNAHLVPLTVVQRPKDAATDLESLALVGAVAQVKQKPHPKAPAFWRWSSIEAWLKNPIVQEEMSLAGLGHSGPVRESRMHVSIEADSQTAQDGALFQTSGLEFLKVPDKDDPAPIVQSPGVETQQKSVVKPDKDDLPIMLSAAKSLALAIETDATLTDGLDFLGGERRAARWRSCPEGLPICPTEVRDAIVQSKHCRLILATPACFENGFLPEPSVLSRAGVVVKVQAVANDRYQVISGWDFRFEHDGKRGRPKPTRRLAPAGSVYFLRLEGSDDAISKFVDAIWLQAISDNEQDCLDGFGLALLGAWDGVPKPLVYQTEKAP